jgi:paraquat-inducible protein A
MTIHTLGTGDPHTIIGGVEALFYGGQWPLAFLVFFASIFVPLMKIMGIVYLLLSVQLGWAKNPKQKTSLYRIVEAVGKWSMIDIFMISILVALVQLGAVGDIVAGRAATFFAAVVVSTMLAAMSFDPRLIWDTANEKNNKKIRTGQQAAENKFLNKMRKENHER